jgi:hypothetical protein
VSNSQLIETLLRSTTEFERRAAKDNFCMQRIDVAAYARPVNRGDAANNLSENSLDRNDQIPPDWPLIFFAQSVTAFKVVREKALSEQESDGVIVNDESLPSP